jgi:GWxTD domain-containing protein
LPPPGLLEQFQIWLDQALPWMTMAWAVGCCLLLLRASGGWLWARRSLLRGARPVAPLWRARADTLAERMGVRRAFLMLESARAAVPQLAGWWRPVILFPASALAHMPVEMLEAVLAHELAHIRRHDYLVNVAQSILESVLFYHPAVWWLNRRVREEREACCDAAAVEACGDALLYSKALLSLEESRPAFALAASGGGLRRRILRLLDPTREGDRFPMFAPVSTLLVLSVLFGGVAWVRAASAPPAPQPAAAENAARRLESIAQGQGDLTAAEREKIRAEAQALREELARSRKELERAKEEMRRLKAELERQSALTGVERLQSLKKAEEELAAAQIRLKADSGASQREMELAEHRLQELLQKQGTSEEEIRAMRRAEQSMAESQARLKGDLARHQSELEKAQKQVQELIQSGNADEAERQRALLNSEKELIAAQKRLEASMGGQEKALQMILERKMAEERLMASARGEMEEARQPLETPYQKWVDEDVVYIIAPEEKAAFLRMKSDEEREKFIEQFWARRDPTPGTAKNEFKEEHYRRIAYANGRFAAGVPGWKTDKGHVYILFGPPDEIESHPGKGDQWRYRAPGKGMPADGILSFDAAGKLSTQLK